METRRRWEGCQESKQIPTAAAGVGGEDVDRISNLPDEIIHKILALVNPSKEAAKASVLSHRWAELWRSYPVLEFHDTQFASMESAKRFADAATKKFSAGSNGTPMAMEAIRIDFNLYGRTADDVAWIDPEFCCAFLDKMLGLAANRSHPPQEIGIVAFFDYNMDRLEPPYFKGWRTYTIPRSLFLRRSKFCLKALNLINCNFDQFKDVDIDSSHFVGLGSSLRQLYLHRVSFPDAGCRILNSMIAGASQLEQLTLFQIVGIRRLEARNLPSLKFLWIECPVQDLEITRVPSLETLYLFDAPLGGDFVVSLMPNLKKLAVHRFHVSQACKLTACKLDALISKAPSLESLSLRGLDEVDKLKMVDNDKLSKLDLFSWNELRVIEMDAPRLKHFNYSGRIDLFLRILGPAGGTYYKEDGRSLGEQYFTVKASENDVPTLRKFLTQQTRFCFHLTLEFDSLQSSEFRWNEVYEELHTPTTIEHVKLLWMFSRPHDNNAFFDGLFQNFHPSYLSFTEIYQFSMADDLCAPEFVERDTNNNHCETGCKCWPHQLKDMKIIKRDRNGGIRIDDEDIVMDISADICSSLDEAKQILLLLTWD